MAVRGFTPRSIIDVGAVKGRWSEMARSIWPGSSPAHGGAQCRDRNPLREIATTIGAKLFERLVSAKDGEDVEFNVMPPVHP